MSNVPQQVPEESGMELSTSPENVRAQLLKVELQESAAQIGQNDWFRAQTKEGRRNRVPYSLRGPVTLPIDGETVGKEGHQGLMSYETMKKIAQAPEAITKDELKIMLGSDFQTVGYNLNFDYLDTIPEEQFRQWMQDVATKRIRDNDAWGKTALGFLKAQGIDVLELDSGKLTPKQVLAIFKLKDGINSIWNPQNANEFKTLLQSNGPLEDAMIEAHKNWRLHSYPEIQNEEYNDPLDELASMLSFYEACDAFRVEISSASFDVSELGEKISNFRDESHKNKHLGSQTTFYLILNLCSMLEGAALIHTDELTKARILKQRDNLLDTIRYDANAAIVSSIMKMGKLVEQTEA